MSHSENGSVITSDNISNSNNQQRLCHIVKRPDFDGYGFNLHSEKGKPGQYIGKVDEKSPAEQAGLRQGDRIIEVNGVNIGNDTHKQVVQRIKAIANEVRLLVIDPEIEKNQNKQIKKSIDASAVSGNSHKINEHAKDNNVNQLETGGNNIDGSSEAETRPISPTTSTKSHTISVKSVNSDKTEPSPTSMPESTLNTGSANGHTPVNKNQSQDKDNIPKIPTANDNDLQSNGNTKSSSPQQQQQQQKKLPGLNLPMTAAEMRAKLQAKKKYDPKNDSVDLRKKFEIIQKL